MVIYNVQNDWGLKGQFQASFGQVLEKFWGSFGQVSKMIKNSQEISKIVKMTKLVKNGQNRKCQINKFQYRSLQMSSYIRLRGGDSMSLTLPSIYRNILFPV